VDPINEFRKEVAGNIEAQGKDRDIQDLSMRWFREAQRIRYSYNFSWLGRPIIQYPQDIVGMQELIWAVKPDLIIETGIARQIAAGRIAARGRTVAAPAAERIHRA